MNIFRYTCLTILISLFSLGAGARQDSKDAIYVWVDGQSVCYRLESSPKVIFRGENALLYVKDREVLSLNLSSKGDLRVVFGQYVEEEYTGIREHGSSNVPKVSCNGKIVKGGRLVIVRDEKMYDVNGFEL